MYSNKELNKVINMIPDTSLIDNLFNDVFYYNSESIKNLREKYDLSLNDISQMKIYSKSYNLTPIQAMCYLQYNSYAVYITPDKRHEWNLKGALEKAKQYE